MTNDRNNLKFLLERIDRTFFRGMHPTLPMFRGESAELLAMWAHEHRITDEIFDLRDMLSFELARLDTGDDEPDTYLEFAPVNDIDLSAHLPSSPAPALRNGNGHAPAVAEAPTGTAAPSVYAIGTHLCRECGEAPVRQAGQMCARCKGRKGRAALVARQAQKIAAPVAEPEPAPVVVTPTVEPAARPQARAEKSRAAYSQFELAAARAKGINDVECHRAGVFTIVKVFVPLKDKPGAGYDDFVAWPGPAEEIELGDDEAIIETATRRGQYWYVDGERIGRAQEDVANAAA